MGKFDIDDILNELGVSDDQAPEQRLRPGEEGNAPDAPKKINKGADDAEESFTSLPAVPSGQRSFSTNIVVDDDPSVPVKPADAPASSVGQAMSSLYQPGSEDGAPTDLGEFLVSHEVVTAQQLTACQQIMKQTPGQRLEDLLVEQGADEVKVYEGVAALAGVPFERVNLDLGLEGGFDGKLLQRLTPDFCSGHKVIPLRVEGSRVVIGATNPSDVFLLDEVRRLLRVTSLKLVVVCPLDIKGALEAVGAGHEDVDLSDILADVEEGDVEVQKAGEAAEVDLEQQAGESPVIRYVNYIIQTAIKEGASDIHIEPAEKKLKVRFRIDGLLFEMMNPPAGMSAAITSRLKIMANLDISERRLPQDGRIRCVVQGRKLDLRVSTLPNSYGEKTVMRILDTKSINVGLDDLGFDETTLEIWRRQIKEPHGIILVTGPTGSGKTTTLYASLRQLDKNSLNISTVEDPVEYHLDGITQTQMHAKIGMDFAKALKALLRQDPDVIMVGEIRDHETAHTAVQAALTGHLVLSTLHTNDAPSSITRMVNIGLEPFLVGAAVNAVLAQRLVRRLCQHCKAEEAPTEEMAEYLTMQGMAAEKLWTPKGCDRCRNTGYSGRVGIYELLTINDEVRDLIARNPNVAEFRRLCIERGMNTLRDDGLAKVTEGKTTIQEVLRVTESGH